jgi:hypothetical protein
MYRLLLVAMVFQVVGFSASNTFLINFDTNIYDPFQPSFQVAPTAGSFTFDPSNMTAPFSDFTVTWDGTIFDMTNAANTDGGPGFGCDSQTAAPRVGINTMFQSFVAPCSNVSYSWAGIYDASAGIGFFTFDASNPGCCTYEVYRTYSVALGGGDLSGQGTYSVSETPEPPAFTELLIGVLALWLLCFSLPRLNRERARPVWLA